MSTFVILAAGNSTRFGRDKLSEPIRGLTLPQRAAQFAESNGADRICVTVNRNSVSTDGVSIFHKVVEDVRKAVARPEMVEIAFQSQTSYGPGAAITAWEGKIQEDFTVLFGDNLYLGKLPTMEANHTYFSQKSLDSNPRNLQLAAVIDGFVIEKPHSVLKGNFFCGFVHFPRRFFEKLPTIQKSSRGEYEISDMINMFGRPTGLDLDSCGIVWGDITYKADLDDIEELVR